MLKEKLIIHSKYGIHARPAADIVKIASQYEAQAIINFKDEYVNCLSIIGLLSLVISEGSEIELEVVGEDEEQAFKELSEYILSMNND